MGYGRREHIHMTISVPGRGYKLSRQQWDTIRRDYEAGASIGSLVREYGVSHPTIAKHRDNEGWIKVGANTDPVDAAIAASASPSTAWATVSEPDDDAPFAEIQSPVTDERDATIADLRSELAKFKPTKVEWAIDEASAARMLADEMHTRIERALNAYNLDRVKQGAPPGSALSLAQMEQVQPGWYKREESRIIRETVDDLTRHATNTGQATRTLAMRKRDGNIVKVPLDDGIGNYGLSPEAYIASLKARGHVELTPQPCTRQDCWAPTNRDWLIKGGLAGASQPMGYCNELHYKLDPYADAGGVSSRATTTASFKI